MPSDTAPAVPPLNPFTTTTCTACHAPLNACGCYPHGSPRYTRENAPVNFYGSPTARFPRYVGVEIECGTPDHPRSFRPLHDAMSSTGAGLHGDGSIRGFSYGLEMVTAPTRGDLAPEHIRTACHALQAIGAEVNETCGAHVHVDARDYSPADMVRLAYLFAVKGVEKTLYSVVSRSRRIKPRRDFTMFALPWGADLARGAVSDLSADPAERYAAFLVNTYGSVSAAESVKRAVRENGASYGKHSSRYHGVSFNAHDIRGTIEFRLHHGTVNARKLTMWAAVCSAIVQYVKDHTDEEVAALRGTPAEILNAILTDREVSRWVRVRRRFFEDKDRSRRGLPPRRSSRPAAAPAADLAPEEDAGSVEEGGEARPTGTRSGRRMSY